MRVLNMVLSCVRVPLDVISMCGAWARMPSGSAKTRAALVWGPLLLLALWNLPLLLLGALLWRLLSRPLMGVACLLRALYLRLYTMINSMGALQFKPKVRVQRAAPAQTAMGRGGSRGGDGIPVHLCPRAPRRSCLPLVGETCHFLADGGFLTSHQRELGEVFETSLDISDSFLGARRVLVLGNLGTIEALPGGLREVGRSGVMGGEAAYRCLPAMPKVAQRLLGGGGGGGGGGGRDVGVGGAETGTGAGAGTRTRTGVYTGRDTGRGGGLEVEERARRWEEAAAPVIQAFLRRLVMEGTFDFDDKIPHLACELLSTLFLGMEGFSPGLLQTLEGYAEACPPPPTHTPTRTPTRTHIRTHTHTPTHAPAPAHAPAHTHAGTHHPSNLGEGWGQGWGWGQGSWRRGGERGKGQFSRGRCGWSRSRGICSLLLPNRPPPHCPEHIS
ncbi:hypothetical protein B484DRAFT_109762 [Ochromonadaceae sp. CCMP2298]|nr:hypothetical protein B484DRAFT_109762 [Ochromonadaceae sp. CCMP2298]